MQHRSREYEQMAIDEAKLIEKFQENEWVKRWGIPFREDPFMELDYDYCIHECSSLEELKKKFEHGNWAIRQAFVFKNLCFVNQVNGGDEWWTIKEVDDGELVAFESISFRFVIRDGKFEGMMKRLLKATKKQCRSLEY